MSRDAFAGIEVPEGEPGALNDAAGQFGAVAAALSGAAGELRGMPGQLSSWSGPASVSYAGTCLTNGTACDAAVEALGQAEHAARAYAGKLKTAKAHARDAIKDARDAQHRIDQAERDIGAAQDRRRAAAGAEAFAAKQIAISAAAATPAPEFEAARSLAQLEGAAAADDEARARRELERAQDDLARAKKRGHEAMDDARDAGRAAAAAFAAAAGSSPAYATYGPHASPIRGGGHAPAGVNWWNTTNEGSKAFDEDAFLAQLVFFHPRNDTTGRYKWWGDQAAGAGTSYGADALIAYGRTLRNSAITEVPVWRVESASRILVAGPEGISVVDQITASRTPTTIIDADTLARSGKYLKAGKAIPYVGGALAIGGAGWDQWRDDAKNPNLTTTDRAGRAVGVGTYVGGASIAGATIGTMILPVGGTAAGLVVGAGVGLLAGAAATSFTPAKEFAADAGQWTANAAVDSYHWTGDRIDDIGDGLKSVSEHIPDLNPF